MPIAGRLGPPECAEGGDCCWLDERTLLAGCGYRTNEAGIARLRELLPDVEVVAFDLPHWRGRGEVMHLMSPISPLAPDLAVVYAPLLPTRLAQLLEARGVELVRVPDEEFDSMGSNVLALAPRVALAVDGNPAHAPSGWSGRASRCSTYRERRALEGRRRAPTCLTGRCYAPRSSDGSSPPQFGQRSLKLRRCTPGRTCTRATDARRRPRRGRFRSARRTSASPEPQPR